MKTHNKISSKKAALFLFTTVALAGCGGTSPGNMTTPANGSSQTSVNGGEDLFSDAGADAPNETQSDKEGERSLRKRFVKVNVGLLKRAVQGKIQAGSTLRLNLFNDQQVEITLEDVQKVSENNIVIVGRIKGDENSAVTLVLKDGVLVANVRRGENTENFEIRYTGNGVHSIRMPTEEEGDCEEVQLTDAERAGDQPLVHGAGDDTATPLANPVIDMLVAYTPAARAAQGGTSAMQALIQMGIADTNRAMIDSGINLSVRLVGMMETSKNESGNFSTDLSALRSKTDGKWDEIHTVRTRLGADQVTLVGAFSSSSGTAGIGYVNATASNAFTVVAARYFKQYTFSHELGHNLGLNHTDGYVSSAGRFRTIIAYGSYPRIRRYSNPAINYNGYVAGDSSHNEAAIVNRNAVAKAALVATVVKSAVTVGASAQSTTQSTTLGTDQGAETTAADQQ